MECVVVGKGSTEVFEAVDLFDWFVAESDGGFGLAICAVNGEVFGFGLADVEPPGLGHVVNGGDETSEAGWRIANNRHDVGI